MGRVVALSACLLCACMDEGKAEAAPVIVDTPAPAKQPREFVGDADAREREVLDLSKAEIADDVLLQLPGSAGLGIDGVAAGSVPEGGASIGTPQRGWLHQGVQLPFNPGLYTRRDADRSFGSTHTIRTIVTALQAMRSERGAAGDVIIGDISRPRGGTFAPHVSHQSGRDIDIQLVVAEGLDPRTFPGVPENVDWDATWALVHSFLETGHVVAVYLDWKQQEHLHRGALRAGVHERVLQRWFQWPGDDAESLIRHEDGHRAHVHIRLSCGPTDPHCRP